MKIIFKTQIISIMFLLSFEAFAQRHFGRRHWPGGSIHHFEMHDHAYWRGGRWHHANHGGRLGWWWVVGPSWYYYSQPIYPYPDPYIPSVIIVPNQQQTPPSNQPAQYWYYCEASKDYYPYVESCPSGWKPVPATPAK